MLTDDRSAPVRCLRVIRSRLIGLPPTQLELASERGVRPIVSHVRIRVQQFAVGDGLLGNAVGPVHQRQVVVHFEQLLGLALKLVESQLQSGEINSRD